MSKVEFLVKVRDNADKIMEGAALIKDAAEERLEKMTPVDKSSWDPSKIAWTQAEGPSGSYEKSEDVNNPEFKAMLRDLGQHDGKLYRDGWFYWTFDNGHTVGRKWKRKKQSDKPGSNPARRSNPHSRIQSNLENLKAAGERLTS